MSTKKILAVLLALFVLATAVSGCGNSGSSSADSQSESSATSENSASTEDTASTDGEVPTISLMVVCGTTPPDADAVAEKLSEITREKIGCNVEFITMEIGNVAQQLNLLLSGGDDTLDVSSTMVREKSLHGEDISGLVPAGVAEYIRKKRLYTHE